MKRLAGLSIAASAGARRPTAPPGLARLMSFLLPAALALYANFQGVQLILVPVQVEAIDPARKVANLALLTILCSITGVAGLMIGGAASDVTKSRFGRRAPWLVAMAAASTILMLALGLQRSLVGVATFYGTLWFALNFFQAAMLAVVPDRVPETRRGHASSIMGAGGPLGALIGVNVVAWAPGELGYAMLAAMLAAATAAFVICAREDARDALGAAGAPGAPAVLQREGRSPLHRLGLGAVRRSLQGFHSRDFSIAFALRVLMFVTQFSINNYLLYILQDHIGVENLPSRSAQIAAGVVSSLRTLVTIGAIFFAGWLANRTERRKVFVRTYALVMAAAMIIPALSPTWPGMVMFGLIGGLAMGAYGAIDLALMSQVLPNKSAAGRDLAILVMAGAAAQFLAPLIGGGLIRLLGYDALFVFCAFGTLGVGAATFLLRGVR